MRGNCAQNKMYYVLVLLYVLFYYTCRHTGCYAVFFLKSVRRLKPQ